MTKRERAILMAYTGGVTFKEDDIQYFLDYVREKSGIELKVTDWTSEGTPIIDFGPDSNKTVDKIREACKEDFDDLINSGNEEEPSKDTAFHVNGRRNGIGLFFKKVKTLEQRLGKTLRPDEVLLLTIFDSIKVSETNEKEEDIFAKKVDALVQRFGRKLHFDEAMLLTLFDSIEITESDEKEDESKTESWDDIDKMFITLALFGGILGKDPTSELKKMQDEELRKYMSECCCDKCDHKEDENG